jgi:hypothetical protein
MGYEARRQEWTSAGCLVFQANKKDGRLKLSSLLLVVTFPYKFNFSLNQSHRTAYRTRAP